MGTDSLIAAVSVVAWWALIGAAVVTFFIRKLRKRHVPTVLILVAFLVFVPIGLGFGFASETTRAPGGTSLGSDVREIALLGIVPLIGLLIGKRFRPVLTALVLVYFFALLLETFTDLYWQYGTSKNFSIPLSHLDALYFALGTLTTGTGNISAISETSRRIQTAQLGIDFLLIGFIVALLVARYSTLFDRSPRGLPPGGATAAEPARSSDRGEPSPDAIKPNRPGADHRSDEHAAPEETAAQSLRPGSPSRPGERSSSGASGSPAPRFDQQLGNRGKRWRLRH